MAVKPWAMTPRAAGLWAAAFAAIVDQAHKYWMLHIFDIRSFQPVHVTSFLDLVMVWNPGISYSLLSAKTATGRWLLIAFIIFALAVILWMLWRAANRWLGIGFGLIAGGALGNLVDRLAYGAVADFFHLFIDTERWGRLSWYVFNLADVAIVAGVALLLYESIFVKTPGEPGNAASVTKSPEMNGK